MNWKPWTWFPHTHEGRQTLIYLSIALAAPVLCGMLIWGQSLIRSWDGVDGSERLARFANISDMIAYGLLILLISFACFISIRAFKLNLKEGTFDVESNRDSDALHDGDDVTVTRP